MKMCQFLNFYDFQLDICIQVILSLPTDSDSDSSSAYGSDAARSPRS